MTESRAVSIKVSVLGGDYALLTEAGLPVPLGLQLQPGSHHLSETNWWAKSTPKEFSLTLYWPAAGDSSMPRKPNRLSSLRLITINPNPRKDGCEREGETPARLRLPKPSLLQDLLPTPTLLLPYLPHTTTPLPLKLKLLLRKARRGRSCVNRGRGLEVPVCHRVSQAMRPVTGWKSPSLTVTSGLIPPKTVFGGGGILHTNKKSNLKIFTPIASRTRIKLKNLKLKTLSLFVFAN